MLPKVLTIAGSDCSGGAGIQADLKAMLANHVYGMSVITALTAQNTQGVTDILSINGDFIRSQLAAIFADIPPDAIKIGMVGGVEQITAISDYLKVNANIPIVLDPVMVSTSGSSLLPDEARDAVVEKLFPLATLITPNLHEGALLWGQEISNEEEMVIAAKELSTRYKVAVLLKGGHLKDSALDVLAVEGKLKKYPGVRVNNYNTHGTGCTLSSTIAVNLAKGYGLEESIDLAKKYITSILASKLDLGVKSGPLDHGYLLRGNRNEG